MIDAIIGLESLLAHVRKELLRDDLDYKRLLWRANMEGEWNKWHQSLFLPNLEESALTRTMTNDKKIEAFNSRYKNSLYATSTDLKQFKTEKQFKAWTDDLKKRYMETLVVNHHLSKRHRNIGIFNAIHDLKERTEEAVKDKLFNQAVFINPHDIWVKIKGTIDELIVNPTRKDFLEKLLRLSDTTLHTIQMTAALRSYGAQIPSPDIREELKNAEMSLLRALKFLMSIRTFLMHKSPKNSASLYMFPFSRDGIWWKKLEMELKICGIEGYDKRINYLTYSSEVHSQQDLYWVRNEIMEQLDDIKVFLNNYSTGSDCKGWQLVKMLSILELNLMDKTAINDCLRDFIEDHSSWNNKYSEEDKRIAVYQTKMIITWKKATLESIEEKYEFESE
eukprot:GHVL01006549.1.p1 GENE.GHVL01006549.1~~GHVL01006549.1.p1  ORF type:complete len:392 (+),score=53.62 GHVL01006549.1:584-1759(+)